MTTSHERAAIEAETLEYFAEALEATASESSYKDSEAVTETWLKAAAHARKEVARIRA